MRSKDVNSAGLGFCSQCWMVPRCHQPTSRAVPVVHVLHIPTMRNPFHRQDGNLKLTRFLHRCIFLMCIFIVFTHTYALCWYCTPLLCFELFFDIPWDTVRYCEMITVSLMAVHGKSMGLRAEHSWGWGRRKAFESGRRLEAAQGRFANDLRGSGNCFHL